MLFCASKHNATIKFSKVLVKHLLLRSIKSAAMPAQPLVATSAQFKCGYGHCPMKHPSLMIVLKVA